MTHPDRIAAELAWQMATHGHRCTHANAIPVESTITGETLAALCPDCDTQLPPGFLDCTHDDIIDITSLGEPPGRQLCQRCGATGWYGDRAVPTMAQLITWL